MAQPKPTTTNTDFASWCEIGQHHFTLERTTLNDIIEALGSGKLERDGTAGAAVYQWFVAYRWNDKIVTFSSNSDMGGSTHDLEEVDIQPAAGNPVASALPIIQGRIHLPFGTPSMSFGALQRCLGPVTLANHQAKYEFLDHVKGKHDAGKPEQGDISERLAVQVAGDEITSLQVSRITSF